MLAGQAETGPYSRTKLDGPLAREGTILKPGEALIRLHSKIRIAPNFSRTVRYDA